MTIEDRVKARLDADRKSAEQADDAASKARKAALGAVKGKTGKLTTALTALENLAVTDARAKAVFDAHAELGKALRDFVKASKAQNEAFSRRAALSSDKEFERRVKQAEKFGGEDTEPLTGKKAAEIVLLQAGTALHYTEITRLALESGVIKLEGKTPEATMSAYLAKAAKKGDTFVRVEPGVFDLASRAKA